MIIVLNSHLKIQYMIDSKWEKVWIDEATKKVYLIFYLYILFFLLLNLKFYN